MPKSISEYLANIVDKVAVKVHEDLSESFESGLDEIIVIQESILNDTYKEE